jgi:hypothetical protein
MLLGELWCSPTWSLELSAILWSDALPYLTTEYGRTFTVAACFEISFPDCDVS